MPCGRDKVGGGVVGDAKGTSREGGLDAGKEYGEEYGGNELHFQISLGFIKFE